MAITGINQPAGLPEEVCVLAFSSGFESYWIYS
jgi:hypothetical protein